MPVAQKKTVGLLDKRGSFEKLEIMEAGETRELVAQHKNDGGFSRIAFFPLYLVGAKDRLSK